MKNLSQTQLKHYKITPVELSEQQLKAVLLPFKRSKQMTRVIAGINNQPGMLTHTILGEFYCNNVSDIRQKAGLRLLKHGLKLACIPQATINPLTKSFHWYLCLVGEVEHFPTDVQAANDAVVG